MWDYSLDIRFSFSCQRSGKVSSWMIVSCLDGFETEYGEGKLSSIYLDGFETEHGEGKLSRIYLHGFETEHAEGKLSSIYLHGFET